MPGGSRLEGGALGNHHEATGHLRQGLHDDGGHRLVEDADRGRALQHPAHDRGRVRIDEVLVDVGPGDGHEQGRANATGQAERGRTGAEGVKGVHDRGPELADLVLDRGLGRHRQIPDAQLDLALSKPAGDAVDRDRVASNRGSGERRQDSHAGGHGCDEPTLGPRGKAMQAGTPRAKTNLPRRGRVLR